jgi:hypothetical protein
MTISKALGLGWVCGAAGAFVLAISAPVWAFCRTHTCNPQRETCELVDGCNVGGKPLQWASSTVSWDVQQDDSSKSGLTAAVLELATSDAFDRWVNVDCPGGGKPSIRLVNRGPIACGVAEYNSSASNANVFTFHDGPWPYAATNSEKLAQETLSFNPETGEIYDSDIEINTNQFEFAIADAVSPVVDLNAVLTHQVGHFLGLSHSAVPESSMYSSYNAGMVTLDVDDVAAICAAYPPGRITASDSDEPRHGFSGECADAQGDAGAAGAGDGDGKSSGCAVRGVGGPSSLSGAALTLVACVVALRRRRRPSGAPGDDPVRN